MASPRVKKVSKALPEIIRQQFVDSTPDVEARVKIEIISVCQEKWRKRCKLSCRIFVFTYLVLACLVLANSYVTHLYVIPLCNSSQNPSNSLQTLPNSSQTPRKLLQTPLENLNPLYPSYLNYQPQPSTQIPFI